MTTSHEPSEKKPRAQASFVEVASDSDFSIRNLPFGVFTPTNDPENRPRCGVAIGDHVLDLSVVADAGMLSGFKDQGCFDEPQLNKFMAMGKPAWQKVRSSVQELLSDSCSVLRDSADVRKRALIPASTVRMHLPAHVGDYTDFYSSREHATNVGTMFRGAENALQPNWLHLPVGYHGRSSSVVPSGTAFPRPCGQLQKDNKDPKQGSTFGPCRLMDFEIEIGAFVGTGNALGERIDISKANDHIFGLVLMNDWSARDIQKWEYVPLGPFTAKNCCTTISPWIVTLDALEPFRCATSVGSQVPKPLPYLQDPNYGSYDINISVAIHGEDMAAPHVISRTNYRYMYWSIAQQLVHHSVTGCNMRPGDLLGSGTISGQSPDSYGSMLELSWRGSKTISLGGDVVRKFLKDNDTVIMRGHCGVPGQGVGFGGCVGKILPPKV